MLGTDIQTDYDTNIDIRPTEWYHEQHLAVVITDAGHAAQARLSVENAERLVGCLNEWIEWAKAHPAGQIEDTSGDDQIPF